MNLKPLGSRDGVLVEAGGCRRFENRQETFLVLGQQGMTFAGNRVIIYGDREVPITDKAVDTVFVERNGTG